MKFEFERYPTTEVCVLEAVDKAQPFSGEDYQRIADICNQPLIYDFLFKERLAGKEYTDQDAKKFVEWSQAGWADKSYYVFLVRNAAREIVACLDIKKTENDPTVREMGYWASSDFPGVVTNAVKVLCEFAHNQGIKELFGLVKTDNEKSIAVLNRSKFENQGELKKDGKTYYKFVQKL